MPVWKLVHILGMFAAFALLLVPLYLQIVVARSGDAHTARVIFAAGKTLGRIAFALFGVGLVGGVAAMNAANWSETSPWLLATYTLLILVAVLDGSLLGPWRKRVQSAFASAGPDARPSSELVALLRSRRPVSYAWATTLALVAIVSLMVLKPSFGL